MSKEMLGELEVFASLTPEQVEVLERAIERRVAGQRSFLHQQAFPVGLSIFSGGGTVWLFLVGLASEFRMSIPELLLAVAEPLFCAGMGAFFPGIFTLILIQGLRIRYAEHLVGQDLRTQYLTENDNA